MQFHKPVEKSLVIKISETKLKKHGSTIIKISKYWTVSKVAVNIPANLILFFIYFLIIEVTRHMSVDWRIR